MLGQGIGLCLLEEGWHLLLTDKNVDHLTQAAEALAVKDGFVCPMILDVTRSTDVRRVVATGQEQFGRIDALINTAGGSVALGTPKIPFVETTMAHRRAVIDTNFVGMLNCTHAVLPTMMKTGKGSIVSIASGAGLRDQPAEMRQRNAAIYSAAKACILTFSKALAQEVGPYGIRVNTLVPGIAPSRWKTNEIRSSMEQAEFEKEGAGPARVPPLQRMTSTRDVGLAVAFLLSDRADHITGSTIDTSGGADLH
jgi:NAD(P)-dependent dehydrogenase (short-subunit alcohol dehydrogenase family)